jgi:hypothetical protein
MKIHVAHEMAQRLEAVWALIGDFGGLARWNKQIAKVETTSDGFDRTRRVTPIQGGLIVERLTAYDAANFSISYEIVSTEPPGPLAGMIVAIRLEAVGPRRSRIVWDADVPDREGVPSREALEGAFRQRSEALDLAAGSAGHPAQFLDWASSAPSRHKK